MLRTILKNTAANYLLKALQMALGIISVPVLINKTGADGYGILVLAGTLLGYFAFFDLGLSDAITKYVAQYNAVGHHKELNRIITTSLAVFMAIGLLLCASVLIALEAGAMSVFSFPAGLETDAKTVFLLGAILSLLAWPKLCLQGVLRGLEAFVSLNIVIGLGRVLAITIAIIAALADATLPTIFVALQADVLLSLVVLPFLVRRKIPGWKPRVRDIRYKTLKFVWMFSGWLMLAKIAVLLEYQLDALVIGAALPVAAITTYTILTYPFRILQQLSGLAAAAVMPAASARHSVGDQASLDLLRIKGAKLHNAFLAIMVIVMLLVLEPFIRIWVGPKYLTHLWIAQLACLFQLFWQSNALLGQVYVGVGLARKPGIVAIFTGLSNLILSIILVQIIGVPGVILGTIVAGAIGVIVFVVWCLPDINIQWRDYLCRIVIAGQGPIWVAGAVLLALQYAIQTDIQTWYTLGFTAFSAFFLLLTVAWFSVLEVENRKAIAKQLKRRRQ